MGIRDGRHCLRVIVMASLCIGIGLLAAGAEQGASHYSGPGVVSSGFIYTQAPFPECHASTIEESGGVLVAAWFGGTHERHRDVGIWVSRKMQKGWTKPVEVANGVQADAAVRHPCWNPVLFQPEGRGAGAKQGPLMLFYKVGPSPSRWWGMLKTSGDHGVTWSPAQRLPKDIYGPIKDKPVELAGGRILCPVSTEHAGWRVHFEWTDDLGKTWRRTPAVNDGKTFGAIQPSILMHGDGRLQALCRSRQSVVTQVWSRDQGKTWDTMKAAALPNPNAGLDGVTLADGRHLLVYNHTVRGGPSPRGREMLNVAVSRDGLTWQAALILEKQPGEYSYPAVIQARDGRVHITYTWRRKRIKHVVVDPARLAPRPIKKGQWPG